MLHRLDRLDRAILLSTVLLLGGITAVVVRGDQIGIAVQQTAPTGIVSSRTRIEVTFDEPLDLSSVSSNMSIDPAVPGDFEVAATTVRFRPRGAFQPGQNYQVTIHAGITATSGRRLKQDMQWAFSVRPLRIVFLQAEDGGPMNLYLLNPPDLPRKITDSEQGIVSFDVAPDGSKIVFVERPDPTVTKLSLWDSSTNAITPLYDCEDAVCNNLAWNPDGSSIALDYTNLQNAALVSPSRIMLLDVTTRVMRPIFRDNQVVATHARWSPDGKWLAAARLDEGGIALQHVPDGKDFLIPTDREENGVFSPDSQSLLVRKRVALGEGTSAQHLVVVDLSSEILARRDLVPDNAPVNDIEAAWRADSKSLVVVRRKPFSANTIQGSQLYLVEIATAQPTPLLTGDTFRQQSLQVSPGDESIIFWQLPVGKPAEKLTLWQLDFQTGTLKQIAENADSPRWLP
jgi:dipeptidyl aminopeptidase/acylaminoacyl peptidase